MNKFSSKNVKNKKSKFNKDNFSSEKIKEINKRNVISNENKKSSKIKNMKKNLEFSSSNKKLETEHISHKNIKQFSQKNKNIFREFVKRALINKGDKELLLIESLRKDPQNRTKDDNNTIKTNFLYHSTLINALLKIPFFEKKNCDNFITAICSELRLKSLNEEENLFAIGDKVDNFYIIYNGNILIENLEFYTITLTCRQYIKSIIDKFQKIFDFKDKYINKENNNLLEFEKVIYDEIGKNYSKYILDKILEENKNFVNIEKNEIELLNLILLAIDIKNIFNNLRGNYKVLLLLIKDYNYDEKIILNGLDYLSNNFFVHSVEFNMKQIYKNIPELNQDLVEKYEIIIENNNYYNFKFFKKGKTTRLQNIGECFGDVSLDLKFNNLNYNILKRNYSAKTTEKTNLAYISFERFCELLKIEKDDIKYAESKFLKSSFFFDNINLYSFTKKYLKYFIYEEMQYNNFLFEQDQKDIYVYFLKYGKYEISCMKNIKSICMMINEISKNYIDTSKRSEYLKVANNIIKNIRWCSFIRKEFLVEMPLKLFVLTQNFVLGLESLYNDIPYLYNVKILSDKCGYYKIEYKHLLQLMKEIKHGNEILFDESTYHLELILSRLINICHKKVIYINNEKKINIFEKDGIKDNINKGSIKTKVITNKIKEFLKDDNKKIKIHKNIKKNENYFYFTARGEENFLNKDKNRAKLYFMTEIKNSNINKNNINKRESKDLGSPLNKFNNNIIIDRNHIFNSVNKNSLPINKKYNKKNRFLENENIKNKYNDISLRKSPRYNPVQIKYEENLIKQLKITLENELLFCSFRNDYNNRQVKTAKTASESKLDKKIKKKELNNLTNIKKEKENKKDENSNQKYNLFDKIILPYFNSSKNVHKKINPSLELNGQNNKNSTRNKSANLYHKGLSNENTNWTKSLTSTYNNERNNKLNLKDNYSRTFNNTYKTETLNKYKDEEKNQFNNICINYKNKSLNEIKNKYKGYKNFNGIDNKEFIANIENYAFKGRKYYNYYKNDYNKTLYKAIKQRIDDSLFMNGQSSSPTINNDYY